MAIREVTLTSTTDTPQQIAAAMGILLDDAGNPVVAKPAEETPAKVDEEPPADEDGDEGDDDEGEEEAQPAAKPAEGAAGDAKPDAAAAKPRHSRRDERISKLTWEKYQKDFEIDRLKKELAARESTAAGTAAAEKTPEPKGFAEPKPRLGDFQTQEDFQDARDAWVERKVKFDLKQESEATRERVETDDRSREQAKVLEQHDARIAAYRATHPNFDALAQKAMEDGLKIPSMMTTHIQHSEFGPAILEHFAQNRDDLDRIAALPPGPQLVAMGELQSELRRSTQKPAEKKAAASGRPAAKSVVPPPAPITPVGTNATSAKKHPGEMGYQEYKRARERGEIR